MKHFAAALLPALAITAFATAPVHASTQPQSRPLNAAAPASSLKREVFGFALASSLGDTQFGYPSWNFGLLSTVAFFGLHVQDDGTFAQDSGWTTWNSAQLTGLLSTAHANGTKVVLTIIAQDFAAGTPHMCAALTHSATTVTNTVAQVAAKGVDGVNVDYEGLNGSCGSTDPSWARNHLTTFVAALRSGLPAGAYLSVDTYASSAADPVGFFNVPGLSASADSLFVMAYDLEYSNYHYSPPGCASFCLGPTAPLAGYRYTDANTASQYTAVVPASKVILGVPYYGRKSCVNGPSPNPYPVGSVAADTYLDAMAEQTDPSMQPGTYATHRDAHDGSGYERWDTWYNTTLKCTRELYWDDTVSLGHKYDLVNSSNLRGVGLWNLNYGGGSPELWQLLAAKFAPTSMWTAVGGSWTSGPGVASWATGRLDLFVRGTDNALWHAFWTGTRWSPFENLGGVLSSDPTAISWGPNRLDVFARGKDNQLWHKLWSGSGWSNWEPLGGVLSSGPTVASWGPGRLDVFVQGTDNGLWHKFYAGAWSAWEPLGGSIAADPGAVSWGPGRIDMFARGSDNTLRHKWWTGSVWSPWESLGGTLTTGPGVSSCGPGRLDVYAAGTGASIYHIGFGGSWSGWQGIGGQTPSRAGAVCQSLASTADLLVRGTDNALWLTAAGAS